MCTRHDIDGIFSFNHVIEKLTIITDMPGATMQLRKQKFYRRMFIALP